MALEPAADFARLYSAIAPDVSPHRPLFTGDIYTGVDISGVGPSPAIVIGHPCSFRGRKGQLVQRTPVAEVGVRQEVPAHRWSNGFFDRMPPAGLPLEGEFHVARLDQFGLALTRSLTRPERIACLSHAGINQLQQRLVFHQTRLEVPTAKFHEAFDHTYEEADLLEEWTTELADLDSDPDASFESWIRAGDPDRQSLLRNPQDRAHVRRAMRREVSRRRARPRKCPYSALRADTTQIDAAPKKVGQPAEGVTAVWWFLTISWGFALVLFALVVVGLLGSCGLRLVRVIPSGK